MPSAWNEALAEVCGPQAPGNALRAMARPDMSQRLAGRQFWQDVLQSFQCDLVSVNNRFDSMLQAIATGVESVPGLDVSVTQFEDNKLFSVVLEGEPARPYRVIVRVRDNPNVGPRGVFSRNAMVGPGESVELLIPGAAISGEVFQYQVGIEFLDGERPFFGRWISSG